jgi:CelD/BcsL family acetyltransferase involved in cellulose biosynthesis
MRPLWRSAVLLERAAEFEVTTLRTIDELEALAPEWHELWLCDPRATPFQSPAWLIRWARRFTAGEVCCVASRADSELVALLPTFVWLNRETQQREVILLGTGISDYCGALCAPGCEGAISAAMEQLSETADWDALNFQELRTDSLLLEEFAQPQSVSPVLELPTCVEELGDHVPKAQLQNLNYYRRRAEKLGDSRWQIADSQSVGAMFEELFALHEARWRERGERGVFADENVRAFHREAARGLLDVGVLRMYRLTIGGETAAVLYGFASHGRTYYYLSGFDPKFASVSPGTLIIGHAIEQAVREGCTHFDFLRGAERYKYLWGAKDTQTFRRVETRACRQHPAGGG